MEPSGPKIKYFLIFSPKKVFLDFDKWNFLYSQSELSELKKLKKTTLKKNSYIPGNGTFWLPIFLIFREMQLSGLNPQNLSQRKISCFFT